MVLEFKNKQEVVKIKNQSWKRRIACFFIFGILMGASILNQNRRIRDEEMMFPNRGEGYFVGGHYMSVYACGEGEDTVVFISGSGTPCAFTDFYYLQDGLKKHAKTVSFDQPGYGWSEPTEGNGDIDRMAYELHELLKKANNHPPYILVAHSLGSLEAIRFAQTYEGEVKSIVMLDGGSPEFYQSDSETGAVISNRISAGIRYSGAARILKNAGFIFPFAGENLRYRGVEEGLKTLESHMYLKFCGNRENLKFINMMNENASRVIDGGCLEGVSIHAISSDSSESWQHVQNQLMEWSDDATQVTLENSKHYIHWSNREEVIGEIIKVLNGEKIQRQSIKNKERLR